MQLKAWQTATAGGVAVLQAIFAIVGGLNGGISAVILNEEHLAILALLLFALASVLVGLVIYFKSHVPSGGPSAPETRTAQRFATAAIAAFIVGVGITGYAAIVTPTRQTRPEITASLRDGASGAPLVLEGTVKANSVKRDTTINIYVQGLDEYKDPQTHEYRYKGINPVLYQAHIGAGATGDATHSFTVPIPTKIYDDVSIDAWAGNDEPCSPPGESARYVPSHKACVIIRLLNVGGREPKKKKASDKKTSSTHLTTLAPTP
jgi:hypothetical protein